MIPVLMTCILSSIIYLYFGLFPYGELTLAWCDARQQVVPLLMDLKDMISGEQSIFLNLQNAGGMDLWGVLFFFVASPLHLLVALVSKENMFDLFNILVMLKMMLAAGTAFLYFRRRFSRLGAGLTSVLASMYAFSGFCLMFYQNVIWLDTAYLFPLLLYGLDRLFQEQKPGLYIGVLCAELFVNYYLCYMVVIFLLLYSGLYLTMCCSRGERRRGVVLFILSSAGAALLTAVIWLPCLLQFFTSARGTNLLDSLRSSPWFPSLETTVPLLFCTGIFLPAIFFFPYKKMGKQPELPFLLIMSLLLTLPLVLEPINRIWHTGSYQCFPARYGYMTVCFLLMVSGAAMEDILERRRKKEDPEEDRFLRAEREGKRAVAASLICVGCVILLAAFLIPYLETHREVLEAYTSSLWGDEESFAALFVAFLPTAVGYGLCLLTGRLGWLSRQGLAVALGAVFAVEAFFCGGVYMGYPASDQSGYEDVLDLGENLNASGFYRVKTKGREIEANWMGAAGLPTLSHYTSLTGEDYLFTLKKLGYSSYWMEADSQGGTAFTDALLSNRYAVVYENEIEADDTVVYANETYAVIESGWKLPSGLIADASIQELAQVSSGDRFEAQNEIYQKLSGTEEELFVRYEPTSTRNLTYTASEAGISLQLEEGSRVGMLTYEIYVEGRQTLYFDCFGGRYTTHLSEAEHDSCMIMVNHRVHTGSYPVKKENGILELGTFEDETVVIEIQIDENMTPASFGVVGLPEDRMEQWTETAQGTEWTIQGNTANAYVENGQQGQTLLLMLPYREGYTVTINGETVEAYEVLGNFIGIELREGVNQIEVVYHTRGLLAGGILSILGIAWIFALQYFRKIIVSAKGAGMRIMGILPEIWLAVMVVGVYVMPLLLARGGI